MTRADIAMAVVLALIITGLLLVGFGVIPVH